MQIISLIKTYYLEYIENAYNSIIARKITQFVILAIDLKRYFSKEIVKIASKPSEQGSMSLVMREMQIKITINTMHTHEDGQTKKKKPNN